MKSVSWAKHQGFDQGVQESGRIDIEPYLLISLFGQIAIEFVREKTEIIINPFFFLFDVFCCLSVNMIA